MHALLNTRTIVLRREIADNVGPHVDYTEVSQQREVTKRTGGEPTATPGCHPTEVTASSPNPNYSPHEDRKIDLVDHKIHGSYKPADTLKKP
jgi:hypothetical protein